VTPVAVVDVHHHALGLGRVGDQHLHLLAGLGPQGTRDLLRRPVVEDLSTVSVLDDDTLLGQLDAERVGSHVVSRAHTW
jgi:hypothetical protein